MELLLKRGTNINELLDFWFDCNKETPLYQATKNQNVKLVKLPLYHGADANAWSDFTNGDFKENALHMACRRGLKEITKLLKYGTEG